MKSPIDRLLLSAAALVAAVAALVFALRGGTAQAAGSSPGQVGRYQLSADEYTYRIIDTTNGDIFTDRTPDNHWEPIEKQLRQR